MTSATDEGRIIRQLECFVVSHTLDPRTGPSIALSSAHAYALVKITDADGRAGWGETYLLPGIPAIIEAAGSVVIGRSAGDLRALSRDVRWSLEHPYAVSAVNIALEDLRARQLGVSVAASFGGPMRTRVRAYAASGGYIEGKDPELTWPAEVERIRAAGFTAMKLRVGRYPVAHEARLLEKIRDDVPDDFQMMADGNAGYTFPRAIEMGAILDRLGFVWFEEPVHQRGGYQGYDRLAAALDIALAGGEILDNAGRCDRAARPRRRRHRPARAGHLRRHRRDAVDRRAGRRPLDPGHAAHLEQRDRDRGRRPDPGLPARPEPVARLG